MRPASGTLTRFFEVPSPASGIKERRARRKWTEEKARKQLALGTANQESVMYWASSVHLQSGRPNSRLPKQTPKQTRLLVPQPGAAFIFQAYTCYRLLKDMRHQAFAVRHQNLQSYGDGHITIRANDGPTSLGVDPGWLRCPLVQANGPVQHGSHAINSFGAPSHSMLPCQPRRYS